MYFLLVLLIFFATAYVILEHKIIYAPYLSFCKDHFWILAFDSLALLVHGYFGVACKINLSRATCQHQIYSNTLATPLGCRNNKTQQCLHFAHPGFIEIFGPLSLRHCPSSQAEIDCCSI